MNLSNPLTVLLVYLFVPNPLFIPGLVRPGFSFRYSTFQSCLFSSGLRPVTPILFGIAKVEIFFYLSRIF
jgi:hypothetical protein